jgi:hypothetical protein
MFKCVHMTLLLLLLLLHLQVLFLLLLLNPRFLIRAQKSLAHLLVLLFLRFLLLLLRTPTESLVNTVLLPQLPVTTPTTLLFLLHLLNITFLTTIPSLLLRRGQNCAKRDEYSVTTTSCSLFLLLTEGRGRCWRSSFCQVPSHLSMKTE